MTDVATLIDPETQDQTHVWVRASLFEPDAAGWVWIDVRALVSIEAFEAALREVISS